METVVTEKPKRKIWYQEKIETLEAELSGYKSQIQTLTGNLEQNVTVTQTQPVDTYSYAQGVYETMCKYQLLSKEQRRRIRDNIIANGMEQFSRSKNPWKM